MKSALPLLILLFTANSVFAVDRPVQKICLQVELGVGADAADVRCGEFQATVAIKSERGIGQAVLRRCSEEWPVKLTIQLGVQPLEGFTATCDSRQLTATLPFNQREFRGDARVVKVDKHGTGEANLKPLQIVIRSHGDSVLIEFPTEFLDAGEDELHLHWVDAWR